MLTIVGADTVVPLAVRIGSAHDPVAHLVADGDDQRATTRVGAPGVGGKRAGLADIVGAIVKIVRCVIGPNGAGRVRLQRYEIATAPSVAQLAGEEFSRCVVPAFCAEKGLESGHVLLKDSKSTEGSVLA